MCVNYVLFINLQIEQEWWIYMNLMNLSFHGMNIGQMVIWFFIYSFCGWAMECVVIRLQLKRWENRGFAKLPFCVIYGFGVLIAMVLFMPIKDNIIAVYIAGCVGATIFEYLTAMAMIKLFGEVWWNYDHLRFNYKGILCLQSTLGWGLLAVFVFFVLNNVIENFARMISPAVANVIGIILILSYILDFAYHFVKNIHGFNSIDKNNSESKSLAHKIQK